MEVKKEVEERDKNEKEGDIETEENTDFVEDGSV